MDLRDKKIVVVGVGNSGLNAALLLRRHGALVKITDSSVTAIPKSTLEILNKEGIEKEIGTHTEGFIKDSEMIVVSPGVEKSSPVMAWAGKYRIPVIGEMELGYRFCKGKIIAITGTNGKTTTTTLIGKVLKDGGKACVVCGNIGNSLCGEIERIEEDTWVVLEVSSFQLETIKSFKPAISIILNITDDHMDRYENFNEYFDAKLKIFANQDTGDVLILNYDAKNLKDLKNKADAKVFFYSTLKEANGAYAKNGIIYFSADGRAEEVCRVGDIRLKGLHNIENVLASVTVGGMLGIPGESIKNTIRDFGGLPHRIETIDVVDGVRYIDDSKGTTVDSTYRALEACDRPVVLIAGGKDKHSDYSYVKNMVRKKVKALILIGEASRAIKDALGGTVRTLDAKDMFDAVAKAKEIAEKGWAVMLSPMCSSFDMFKDYKERGEAFKKAVAAMKNVLPKVNV